MALWERLFDLSGLTPHGFCLTWDPGLIWLDAGSDTLIVLSYFFIPISLLKLVRGRTDLLPRWLLSLFAAFILSCGASHLMSIVTLWLPLYLADGLMKLLTAVLSVVTALCLQALVPDLLSIPSRGEMERLNRDLREKKMGLLLAQEAGGMEWSDTQHALYNLPQSKAPVTREAWLSCIDSADREAVDAKLAAAISGSGAYEAEFRIVLPDGGRRWVAARGQVMLGPDNTPVRMVGASVDITDRAQLTERLTATNQLLSASAAAYAYAGEMAHEQMRVMFEHSPDAQFVMRVEDKDDGTPCFVFEAINPANEHLTGRPAAAFLGKCPEQCCSPEDAAELNAAYRRCLRRDGVTTFVMRRSVRGRARDFETSLTPVRDPRSFRVSRIIGVSRDVTERNALEQQLRHVAKMEATHRLTAGIAHDFNNMLQGLMGGLEMLLLEAPSPTMREYAEIAMHSAQRGAELTHRLLAFSRQQALQTRPVDAGQLLSNVARLLEPSLSHRYRLVVAPVPAPVMALADPGQLEAAIVNLVVNAADAMPGGGQIDLSVALATHVAGLDLGAGPYAVLSVRDSGTGMTPAVLAQACEPFFTTKGVNGSGLGLSMVQGFARQSGGDLCLESTVGVGTCVQVWLPLAEHASAKPPAHLLLVDDAADVLVTAGAFLRHAGYEVTRVASGQQALAHLASGARCDAVVTDFAMPGLNGIDLLTEVRDMRPGLPGLIITGYDHTGVRAYEVGARVLPKPFTRLALLEEVNALLERSNRQAAHTAEGIMSNGFAPATPVE
jgi:PAS domain S-box-containing protein